MFYLSLQLGFDKTFKFDGGINKSEELREKLKLWFTTIEEQSSECFSAITFSGSESKNEKEGKTRAVKKIHTKLLKLFGKERD